MIIATITNVDVADNDFSVLLLTVNLTVLLQTVVVIVLLLTVNVTVLLLRVTSPLMKRVSVTLVANSEPRCIAANR